MKDDDEVREFLTGWLLEFGTGVVGGIRSGNKWYTQQHRSSGLVVNSRENKPYLDRIQIVEGSRGVLTAAFQLNQAGLDFIKGESL